MSETNGQIQAGNIEHVVENRIGNIRTRVKAVKEFVNISLRDVLLCPNMIHSMASSIQARKCGYTTAIETLTSADKQGTLIMINNDSGDVDMIRYKTRNGQFAVTRFQDETECSKTRKNYFISSDAKGTNV